MNKIFAKYFPIFFIFLSLCFLSFVVYKSEYFHQGVKAQHYKIYYIIGISFLFFSIVNFFLNEEVKIKISIIVLSTIFSLYLIEVFLLVSGLGDKNDRADNPAIQIKIKKEPNFDTRSLVEVYEDMKTKNKNTVLAIYPNSFLENTNQQLLQLSGISNRKTILCNENGYYATYQSDRYGFNNPDSEWDKKQVAFFLVGDSFLHGSCVNEKDTISGNIRKKIKSGSVLNLGYGDDGPLSEYATLREYLPLTNAKKVIWVYCEVNDLRNLNSEINNLILPNYLNNKEFTQNLPLRQNDVDMKLKEFLEKEKSREQQFHKTNPLLRFIKLSFFRRYTTERIFSVPSLDMDEILDKFTEIISLSKSFTQKRGAKFYFVYLPDTERYFEANKNTNDYNNYEKIINIVKKLDVPIIDINKELHLTVEDPLALYPFRMPGHYNELGYRLVAETILKKIDEYDKLKKE